ncbi:phage major capsid protein [Salmonella enterica]|nr:phage major capsid protein [Salmonella enterica]EBA9765544.1 phage major capsid protein [Salmonella enterica]EEB5699297.1 phage major capsid protein [Salmonella enterica]EGX5144519.1 phage major capsid protein [Salmonella enterica]ELF4900208.1 phage major capsid protein [Salmonella enterica]
MIHIEALRRQRAEINEQVQTLAAIEAGGGTLTDEQMTQFSGLQAHFDDLTARMERQEAAEKAAALVAKPVTANTNDGAPAVQVKAEPKQYPGAGMARMVMSIAAGRGDMDLAAKFATSELNDKSISMAISTASGSGGALIPQNMQSEVIELLRDRTIVRRLGARPVPLPNGNMSLPRLASGSVAGYVGEGTDVKATGATFDDVKLSAKTLICLVPVSNQLIGRAGFDVEQLILDDIISGIATREDKAFLRDDGTSNTPKGMKAVATEAKRTQAWAGTDYTLNAIDTYLDNMILMAMNGNSNMLKCGWGLSNRSYMKLYGLRDGNGNKVYPEMAQGMLKGYPVERTSAIPSNLGAGSNESEIYFADFNDVLIGDEGIMTVDFSREAAYVDADGGMVSSFSRNQSVIRVVTDHDIGFRHVEGLVLGTGVTW